MEEWEVDFHWLKIRHWLKDKFNRGALPDMKSVLFLVGIQEYGNWGDGFTKEEKQDLIHVATCVLLSRDGYYSFAGLDDEGWPHFNLVKTLPFESLEEQEHYLKIKIIEYFDEQIQSNDESE